MTEKLYWKDQKMKEFYANVVSAGEEGVILDKTAFYPRGGGQPADTGFLMQGDNRYEVTNVEKKGDDVVHIMANGSLPEPGERIFGKIDWGKRESHMRYHTAIHVMDGIITRKHGSEGTLTGSQIYQDRARVDFDMADLTKEKVLEIIEETNEAMKTGMKVYSKEIDSQEALNTPNISRTMPGRELLEKLDRIRIIVIEGLDEQADGGTHVSNTLEVGKIVFRKLDNKGKRNKRVEFYLERWT